MSVLQCIRDAKINCLRLKGAGIFALCAKLARSAYALLPVGAFSFLSARDHKYLHRISGAVLLALFALQAQAVTLVSGTIAANTTWSPAGGVYVLTGTVTVPAGVTLTIAPGTIVKGNQVKWWDTGGNLLTTTYGLVVNGTLNAVGTALAPIVFTAYTDDTYGGDTNGDGNATVPSAGYWAGIAFNAASTLNQMSQVVVKYGGTNISVATSGLTLSNSTVSDSSGPGISVNGGTAIISPTISGNVIERAAINNYGVQLNMSNAQITGNTIRNNGSGIYGYTSTPTITNNTITGNTGYAFVLSADSLNATIAKNTVSGNKGNGISVTAGMTAGNIAVNTTLNADVPYVLDVGNVAVNAGVTLTLAPGTIVKGNQVKWWDTGGNLLTATYGLVVNGTLNAVGTALAPIVFTAYTDDTYGGDTNGDGNATVPSAGYWGGIAFNATSTLNQLNQLVVKYGGGCGNGGCPNYGSSIYVATSGLTLSNSTVSDSGGQGVYINGGTAIISPTISGNMIERAAVNNSGIQLNMSNAQIIGNTIRNNGYGIYGSASSPTITNNTITGHTGFAIFLTADSLNTTVAKNTLSGNKGNGISINAWNANVSANTTLNADVPYVLDGGNVTVNAGVVLTLAPGTIVKGNQVKGFDILGNLLTTTYGLVVNGTLNAVGTALAPIVFTAYTDDTYGGDTNGDGNATVPSAGYWGGIAFNATSTLNQLNQLVVKYGGGCGNGGPCPSNGASIYVATSGLTLSNSTVSDSGGQGVYINGGTAIISPTISGNVIERSAWSGIYLNMSNAQISGNTIRNNGNGIYGTASSPTITNNTITGNITAGIINPNTGPRGGSPPATVITAKSNYWGSPTGPYDPLDDRATGGWYNPTGTGNMVSNYVDYTPWLLSDPNARTAISLSGYVQDANTGLPLANVFVQLGMYAAYTNSNGYYVIGNLPNNAYPVKATLKGYTSFNGFNAINPLLTPIYNISLAPDKTACAAGTLSGTVRDATNGVIQGGVTVVLTGVATTTTSLTTGGYSFANVAPGTYTISVSAAGYTAYNQNISACGNQAWDIGLAKPSTAYGPNSNSAYSQDPVNTATGNYIYSHRDVQLPGKGMPFVFERNYNSQAGSDPAAVSGPLGFGWTHNYNISLAVVAGNVTINWGDGKTESYAANGTGGFIPQYGVFDTLIVNAGGTYTLKKKDLSTYNFDAANHLASMVDRNGNTVMLTYTGANLTRVTDTAGRNIDFAYDAGNRIVTITDPLLRTVKFTYDAAGNLATAQDANNNITRYSYDASHQLTLLTDPRGNAVVTNVYDAAKRVVNSQKDAKLGATTYVYDPVNHKTTVTDALNNVTVDYHDTLLRAIRQDDARGNRTLSHYDAAGNRDQATDKNGNLTTYTYDAKGNVTGKVDALGKISAVTYDANNNPLTRTDALGNVTTFTYDLKGNLLSVTDALANTVRYTYSAAGQVLTTVDARNNTTTNTYDLQGNLTQVTDALNNITTYTYDAAGRRLTKKDALNRTTTFAYDNNDNLLSTTDPNLKSTSATYDGNNNRITATDKRGNVTTFAYDVKDLLTTTTDPLFKTVVNSYDAIDRKTAVQDKNGKITQYAYDVAGNLIGATDALLQVTQFTYDANGNRLSAKDPLGHIATYTYDALNRQVTAADALANTSTTVYDALGRVSSVTNAKNQATTFSYDNIGRLLQVTDAGGGTVKYSYDANGNRLTMTDPNNHVTSYTYDALNRLISKTEPLLGVTQYLYDAVGNRSQVTLPNGTIIRYAYDSLDRLQSITYPNAATVTFAYDFDGNRTGMTDALGISSAQYDALGRMTSYTDPFGKTVGYAYDANGNRTSLTYPGNKAVNYTYDALNRLTGVTDWLTHQTTYAYDSAGRLTGSNDPNTVATTYGYDVANRLTSLKHAQGPAAIASYGYTLDAIGNHTRVALTEPLPPVVTPGTANYTYDVENRLTAINGVANTYDANGNMTARGADTYTYDFENRLQQSAIAGTVSQYQYDGLGHRYARTSGGATTRYVLDLNSSLSKVLMETDALGNASTYYVYGQGLISRISAAGVPSYYHFDSRGSTVVLTDATGAVTDKYAYDPFGKLSNSQGVTPNPFKYLGQYGVMDEGNGLYYIRARYYDPQIGRFINKDPKAGNDKDGQSLHRYIYAQNNPVIFVDVSGFSRSALSQGYETISILGMTMCDANQPINAYFSCLDSISRDPTLGNLAVWLSGTKAVSDTTMAVAGCFPATKTVSTAYDIAQYGVDLNTGVSMMSDGNNMAGWEVITEKPLDLAVEHTAEHVGGWIGNSLGKSGYRKEVVNLGKDVFGKKMTSNKVFGAVAGCGASIGTSLAHSKNSIQDAWKNR